MRRKLKRENLTDEELNNLSYKAYVKHKMQFGISRQEAIEMAEIRGRGIILFWLYLEIMKEQTSLILQQ